jgi:hypothetical protein
VKLAPIAIAFVIAAFVSTAFAQGTTSTPRIDQRQENQQQRIDKGVSSGTLNERESARMQKGQDRVNKMEDDQGREEACRARTRRPVRAHLQTKARQTEREVVAPRKREVDARTVGCAGRVPCARRRSQGHPRETAI